MSHRDDFLGIVSHDLHNIPGGVVIGAALLSDLPIGSTSARAEIDERRVWRT